jgi:hypothetical protein
MDDYSPVYRGDSGAILSAQFLYKDGTPVNLSGATISMEMQGSNTDIVKVCSNTGAAAWTFDDAVNGRAHRRWQASDVDTVDIWRLFITITNSNGPVHADEKLLEVRYSPQ